MGWQDESKRAQSATSMGRPPGTQSPHAAMRAAMAASASSRGYPPLASMSSSSKAPMDPLQDAARARAVLIDRERRQVFGYLSSPNCFLFSDVQGAVSLTEEDLDLLLAAGGTSSSTLSHLEYLDGKGSKFKGFADLIPAVEACQRAVSDSKKDILAYLSGPKCNLFGKTSTVFITKADVDRIIEQSTILPHTYADQRDGVAD
jgi:hypothetical protein